MAVVFAEQLDEINELRAQRDAAVELLRSSRRELKRWSFGSSSPRDKGLDVVVAALDAFLGSLDAEPDQ
jgi:hypothetical protein